MNTQPAADLFATYRRAEALLVAGQVRQAADLCKEMLDADPDFAYGHHLMSALFRMTGNLDKSLYFADLALKHGPDVALFHVHQGQVWLLRNHLPAAALAFKHAHRLDPVNPLHLVLLADTRTHQKKFDEAIALYAEARSLSDLPEIDEHEGHCRLLKGDVDGAELLFDRLILRAPHSPSGYFHKAKTLVAKKRDAEAEGFFEKTLALNPRAYDAALALAMLHYRQKRLPKAIEAATRAMTIEPGNWRGLVLLGGLLVSAKNYEAAEKMFRQVLTLQPDNAYAMHGLVTVLLPQHRLEEARAYVGEALKHQPQQPVLLYFQAMLQGKTVDTAPREYVAGLFDGYAEQFDQHLQQSLAYKAPFQLATLMRGLPQLQEKRELSLLDLGCGTGLVAEAFKDITRLRVGVDVSMGMIEKAAAKRLYNALHQADAVAFLLAGTQKFDLVAATDVFIYVGAMEPFMKAVRSVMDANSLFGFSIESETGEGFHLNDTGRYSHSETYVMRTVKNEGFELAAKQDIALRVQADALTRGTLYVVKKTQTH